MPRNTALTEAISEDRGYLVNSGTNPSLFTILPHDNEIIRPLVDVEDMVKQMLAVYNNYDAAKEKAEAAYKWVTTELAWGGSGPIVDRWVKIFDKMYEAHVQDSVIPEHTEADEQTNEIESEQF